MYDMLVKASWTRQMLDQTLQFMRLGRALFDKTLDRRNNVGIWLSKQRRWLALKKWYVYRKDWRVYSQGQYLMNLENREKLLKMRLGYPEQVGGSELEALVKQTGTPSPASLDSGKEEVVKLKRRLQLLQQRKRTNEMSRLTQLQENLKRRLIHHERSIKNSLVKQRQLEIRVSSEPLQDGERDSLLDECTNQKERIHSQLRILQQLKKQLEDVKARSVHLSSPPPDPSNCLPSQSSPVQTKGYWDADRAFRLSQLAASRDASILERWVRLLLIGRRWTSRRHQEWERRLLPRALEEWKEFLPSQVFYYTSGGLVEFDARSFWSVEGRRPGAELTVIPRFALAEEGGPFPEFSEEMSREKNCPG